MTDIATLGLAVDSSGVDKGAQALDRLTTAAGGAGAAASKVEASFNSASRVFANDNGFRKAADAMKLTSFEARNLAFQMNDVATMLVMGASPMQVLASQGGQVMQIFQGSAGGLSGFVSGMAALATPTNLVAAGLLAAGAGALLWATRTVDATEAIEKHLAAVKAVKTGYDDLVKGQKDVAKESVAVQEALMAASRAEVEKKFRAMTSSLSTRLQGIRTADIVSGDFTFDQPIMRFVESVRAGTPDVIRFREELAAIANNTGLSEEVRKAARDMLEMTNAAGQAQSALRATALGIEAVGNMAAAQVGAIRGFNAALGSLIGMIPEASKSIEAGRKVIEATKAYEAGKAALIEGVRNGAIGGGEMVAQMQLLKQSYAEALKGISGVTEAEKRLGDAIAANKARLAGDRLGSRIGAINAEYEKNIEEIRKMSMTGATTEHLDGLFAQAKIKRDTDILLAKQNESFKAGAGGKSDMDKFDDIITRAEAKIAMARMELQAVGLGAEETARMKAEQQLLNEAKQKDIDLTPQQVAQIKQLAAAQAQATAAADQAKKDLDFAKDATKGFLSTLRQGLMQGQSFWQSFGNAAISVINKIIDKLETQLVDALFKSSGAGGGGLFGGLFSGIGKLFGFAKGGVFGAGGVHAFANGGAFSNSIVSKPTLFKFANGTGLMGEAGPEAIMPLSRDRSGRLGVRAQVPSAARVGTHVHTTVGVAVDDEGSLRAYVKKQTSSVLSAVPVVAARVARAGISEFSNNILPGRLSEIELRGG